MIDLFNSHNQSNNVLPNKAIAAGHMLSSSNSNQGSAEAPKKPACLQRVQFIHYTKLG